MPDEQTRVEQPVAGMGVAPIFPPYEGRLLKSDATLADHGHEFTHQNTYLRADGSGRACRKCNCAAALRSRTKNEAGSSA